MTVTFTSDRTPWSTHELGDGKAGLGRGVLADHGLGDRQRQPFQRAGLGLRPDLADHAGLPADAGADQQRAAIRLQLQHLGQAGTEPLGDQPAGIVQDLLQVVGMQRQLPEAGERGLLGQQSVPAALGWIGHGGAKARQPWRFRDHDGGTGNR